MELRSSDIKNYKMSLVSAGLYEEGMKLKEMKEMVQALEESQLECESTIFQSDLERAKKESEITYMLMRSDVHPLIMNKQTNDGRANTIRPIKHRQQVISQNPTNTDVSPFSSPENASEKIVVKAWVHNDMNCSPPQLKRTFDMSLPKAAKKCPACNLEKRRAIEDDINDDSYVKRSKPPTDSLPECCKCYLKAHAISYAEDEHQTEDEYTSDPSF